MEGYGFPPRLEGQQESNGWWPTPDTGFLDEAGYLTLMGRLDDYIKTRSGYLVNPAEVAGVLLSYPGITDAAVVALPSPTGPVIGALVECEMTVTLTELRSHIARLLPPWSQPRALQVINELPRLPGGKADRRICIEILEKSL